MPPTPGTSRLKQCPGGGGWDTETSLGSGSPEAATAPKHHGSEGRIGPAAGSPECQTSLSERLETKLQTLPLRHCH